MMKYKLKSLLIMTVLMVSIWMLCSCKKSDKAEGITKTEEDKPEPKPDVATVRAMLVDKTATDETAALFYNMKTIAKTKIMFGHQDDSRSGFAWSEVPGRSDVKEVTGAYPAVYGADFLFLTSFEWNPWYDDQKVKLYDTAIEVYKRGGISVFSWHYNNPVSQGSFYWDSSPVEAVTQILPGGNYNEVYNASLKRIADFANSLVVDGKAVPFIFRPFHETDGAWFWWGATRCSDQDYKELYQYTVTYLRDVLHVHNILYGWTPGGSDTESQLLRRYPGDDYVDLIGNDDYFESAPEKEAAKLKVLSDYAKSKNKLAALTETGLANVTQHNWYTQVLLKALKTNKVELAYVSAWGNTQYGFFTPYKGFNQAAEDDFVQFKNDQYLMFGDKMPNVYKINN